VNGRKIPPDELDAGRRSYSHRTNRPEPTQMTSISPITWHRREQIRTRRLAPADRAALDAVTTSPEWWWIAGTAESFPVESSGERARSDPIVLFESELEICGGAALRAGSPDGRLGRQPWSNISRPRVEQHSTARSPRLLVEALGWRRGAFTARTAETWLRDGLVRRARRLGADQIVAPVPFDSDSRPESRLQQIQFRGVDPPPKLRPFFAVNFELRGFYRSPRRSSAVAVLECRTAAP